MVEFTYSLSPTSISIDYYLEESDHHHHHHRNNNYYYCLQAPENPDLLECAKHKNNRKEIKKYPSWLSHLFSFFSSSMDCCSFSLFLSISVDFCGCPAFCFLRYSLHTHNALGRPLLLATSSLALVLFSICIALLALINPPYSTATITTHHQHTSLVDTPEVVAFYALVSSFLFLLFSSFPILFCFGVTVANFALSFPLSCELFFSLLLLLFFCLMLFFNPSINCLGTVFVVRIFFGHFRSEATSKNYLQRLPTRQK